MVKEAKLQLNFLFTFLVIPVQTWLYEDYQSYYKLCPNIICSHHWAKQYAQLRPPLN